MCGMHADHHTRGDDHRNSGLIRILERLIGGRKNGAPRGSRKNRGS